jgi:Ni,Fe-hydrogenase I cytochrome b subunit
MKARKVILWVTLQSSEPSGGQVQEYQGSTRYIKFPEAFVLIITLLLLFFLKCLPFSLFLKLFSDCLVLRKQQKEPQ